MVRKGAATIRKNNRANTGKNTARAMSGFKQGLSQVAKLYAEQGYLTPKAIAILNKWKKK